MIAYWLMPASPQREFIASLISDLAGRFDAPLFEGHLSIYAEDVSRGRATRVLNEVATDFGQIRMSVAGIRFSEEFFKTIFVQFFASAMLTRLSEAIQSRSVDAGGFHLDPHLSLIYKTMPADEKNRLAASLRLPFDEVIFDSVAAINVPNEAKTPAGVESWEKVAERRLKIAGV
jgi:Cyclic phosphodiesterase-like protein